MTGRVLGFEVIRRKNGNEFASAVSAFVPSPDRAMGRAAGPFCGAVLEVMLFFPVVVLRCLEPFSDLHFGAVWACLRRSVRVRFSSAGCR